MKKFNFHAPILTIWQMKFTRRGTISFEELSFGNISFPCQNAFETCTTKTELCAWTIWTLLLYLHLFCPIWSIGYRVTKINFKYFNGNCDYSSCPGWSILFLYAPAHKGSVFWKNYLWATLSLSYFIFLFSCSLKITFILLRQAISRRWRYRQQNLSF